MELYQLKTFVAVAAEGNLSRAAEKVFISLPAVSAQIKALEDELGVQLFDRVSKGMRLTEAGERLLAEARGTLEAADRMNQVAAQIRGQVWGHAQIGVLTDSLPLRLGTVMMQLARRHPKLDVKLQRDVSGRVIKRVRDGELDGGFALCSADQHGVHAMPLASIDLAVVLPIRFSSKAPRLSLKELRDIPWIDSVSECALNDATRDVFKAIGDEPEISYIADSDGALRSMVASGLGAGVLRRTEAENGTDNGEMVIWPHWQGRTQLCWISRPSAHRNGITAAIQDAVLTTWDASGKYVCE